MKNPNGYGSVYKLSGRRRRPYAARITVGFKDNETTGKSYPIYKFLGYYVTRKEAMNALAIYNSNPEAITTIDNALVPSSKITLQKLYDEWSAEHFQTIKKANHYESAFKILKPLYDHSITSLKIGDYEKVFEESGKNQPMLRVTKSSLKLMYQFAFRKGYIDESAVNIPTYISFANAKSGKKEDFRKPFTHEEIEKLWEYKDDVGVQVLLFLIYTGTRISEAVNLSPKDVHLKERYFDVKVAKTEAGIRKVPIAKKILPFVEKWVEANDEFLVPFKGKTVITKLQIKANGFLSTIAKYLGTEHTQHDTRHTCISLLTENEVDERFIKLIVGHASQDVTNKVYAKKLDIAVLIEAIDKI